VLPRRSLNADDQSILCAEDEDHENKKERQNGIDDIENPTTSQDSDLMKDSCFTLFRIVH
jgi:hypothetical protein